MPRLNSDEKEVDTVLTGDAYARQNLYFHILRCRGKGWLWIMSIGL
ncbi:MAG: hypothetical protein ACLUOI_05625 [Eisenbergiella sp.]